MTAEGRREIPVRASEDEEEEEERHGEENINTVITSRVRGSSEK